MDAKQKEAYERAAAAADATRYHLAVCNYYINNNNVTVVNFRAFCLSFAQYITICGKYAALRVRD